ncbi:MAG: 23S rRNA (uracil(1939)-C(5))-methyltransferase RlmD [Clostridiales bacterium]|nr:23S rRNA (uracil(1939)-C(5))-methyltransferase RlmD [Clostridiales bacterium]
MEFDPVDSRLGNARALTAPPRKNAVVPLSIDDVDSDGFGIGKHEGFAVFVDGALPGDVLRVRLLKIKPRFAYGKIEKILTPSPHRADPACPVASRCGGCQFQHCAYSAQLIFKKRMVEDALRRIGKVENPPVADVLGMAEPFHYRGKGQFPAGEGIGLYAPRSHKIIPVASCHIQHPAHAAILEAARLYLSRYGVPPYDENSHTGLVRHVMVKASFSSGEVMAALIINGDRCPWEKELAKLFTDAGASTVIINPNTKRGNVILGDRFRVLTGDGYIRESVGDITYRLSARSFFQVNPAQTKVLYDTALKFGGFTGNETVIDAHAGVGGVALYAAKQARFVYGVEIVGEAVDDAVYNAEQNGIKNARFVCGAAEEEVEKIIRGKNGGEAEENISAVFLDPPRKGCGRALLDAVSFARIPKVIYISCDPATLARDIKLLREGGYGLEKVQPVDMFPQTGKVEAVALLTANYYTDVGTGFCRYSL